MSDVGGILSQETQTRDGKKIQQSIKCKRKINLTPNYSYSLHLQRNDINSVNCSRSQF
jgi:hypothetical protein